MSQRMCPSDSLLSLYKSTYSHLKRTARKSSLAKKADDSFHFVLVLSRESVPTWVVATAQHVRWNVTLSSCVGSGPISILVLHFISLYQQNIASGDLTPIPSRAKLFIGREDAHLRWEIWSSSTFFQSDQLTRSTWRMWVFKTAWIQGVSWLCGSNSNLQETHHISNHL